MNDKAEINSNNHLYFITMELQFKFRLLLLLQWKRLQKIPNRVL